VVEASADLAAWTQIATLATGSDAWTGTAAVTETGAGRVRAVTVTNTTPVSAGKGFLHLRVSP
jgi:hypothetical protein